VRSVRVRARLTREPSTVTPRPPAVEPRAIDTGTLDWAPQIAFVTSSGLIESLSLKLGSPELAALQLSVAIAGAVGAPVILTWEIWDRVAGWRPGGTDQPATVGVARLPDDGATGVTVQLPSTAPPGGRVLYAAARSPQRQRADHGRSDPLLVPPVERADDRAHAARRPRRQWNRVG
jgi:hypothetical protein